MNICFITKYPPIQGGVSAHCYWAARGLAERGHNVFVVTNANEVEETFRIALTADDLRDGGDYAKTYPDQSTKVSVFSTERPDYSKLYYIPLNNPTVTRLATIASNVIKEHSCDVIFAYYLEPYGVAAHLASHWTGVPYVFKHAGSDLNRLLPLEDLKTAYVEVLKAANRVISRGRSRKQLLSYGISEDRIDSTVAFGIPTQHFQEHGHALDLWQLGVRNGASQHEAQRSLVTLSSANAGPLLGIYGKMGEYKGTFDLAHALAHLAGEGFPVSLVAVSHGWQEHRFRDLTKELGIEGQVTILPFLPPWKIPSFIRACTAVAFLERDFPIATHTPTIPLEVIECSKCLIVSAEVARKQLFRTQIRNRRNAIVVNDPKDHFELAQAIRFALEDPQRAGEIGRRGREDLGEQDVHEQYIDNLEALLTRVATESPVDPKLAPDPSSTRGKRDLDEFVIKLFPHTSALLADRDKERLREAIAGTSLGSGLDERSQLARELGRHLVSLLERSNAPQAGMAREVCRYECRLHELAAQEPAQQQFPELPPVFSAECLWSWQVALTNNLEVMEFDCDVDAIVRAIQAKQDVPAATPGIRVLCGAGPVPLQINEATHLLIDLIGEGSYTVGELLQLLIDEASCGAAASPLVESCLAALEGLYWAGAISLTETSGHEANTRDVVHAEMR